MIGAYIRVSSRGQDYEMQRAAILRRLPEGEQVRWYEEKRSAKTTDRPELQAMIRDVTECKLSAIWAWRFDRLVRSGVRDLLNLIALFEINGVPLHTVADGIDVAGAYRDVVLAVFATAARIEREAIAERIAAARDRKAAKGEPWGRRARLDDAQGRQADEMRQAGRSVRSIAMALGVPKSSVQRTLTALSRKPTPETTPPEPSNGAPRVVPSR